MHEHVDVILTHHLQDGVAKQRVHLDAIDALGCARVLQIDRGNILGAHRLRSAAPLGVCRVGGHVADCADRRAWSNTLRS